MGRLTELSSVICHPFPLSLNRWSELGFELFAGFFGWPESVTQGTVTGHFCGFSFLLFTTMMHKVKKSLKNFRSEHEVGVLNFLAQSLFRQNVLVSLFLWLKQSKLPTFRYRCLSFSIQTTFIVYGFAQAVSFTGSFTFFYVFFKSCN